MKLIHLSHCVYHCDYHIVVVTKYRKEIFNAVGVNEAIIKKYIEEQGKKDSGQTLFEMS